MSLVYPGGGWDPDAVSNEQLQEAARPLLVPLCCSQLVNVFPILLRIPGLAGKVFSGKKALVAMLDELLTEHKMTWDPAQPPRDLTDAFLAEVEKVTGSS